MLFVEKEELEGVKYNIDFGVRGESTLGREQLFPRCKKGPFYRSVSTLWSLIVACMVLMFSVSPSPLLSSCFIRVNYCYENGLI